MTQSPFASSRSFRRDGGEPFDGGGIVIASPVTSGLASMPGVGQRWLVATVEPIAPTAYAWDIAQRALDALRQGFAEQYDATVTQALARGFAAANACVRAANRGDSGPRRAERVFVGASAFAIDGDHLVLAHVPPSQVLFSQDRMVYAIPSLHSWESHYAGTDRGLARPLGAGDQIHPDIFRTLIEPRDTFVLCSTNLGRAMTGLAAVGDRLQPPTDPTGRPMSSLPVGPAEHPISLFDIGAIRPAGPDGASAWVDWLDHVSTERQVPSCHAVAVTLGQVTGRSSHRPARPVRRRPRTSSAPPEPEPGPGPVDPSHPGLRSPAAPDRLLDRHGLPRMLNVPVPPVTTGPVRGPGRLPGAHGVARHADAPRSGSTWRSAVPRLGLARGASPFGPIHIPRWLTVSLVALLVLSLGFGAARMRQASTAETLALSLSRIDSRIDAADLADDASELGTVRGQLETLAVRYGDSGEIARRGIWLTSVEDRLLGRSRLDAAISLGTLPESAMVPGREIRLIRGNSGIYLVGASVYALDPANDQLVELLRPGTTVDGETVGTIVDAVATRSGIAATDGRTVYYRGASGSWTMEAIAAELPVGESGSAGVVIVDGQVIAIDRESGTLISSPLMDSAVGGTPYLSPEIAGLPGVRAIGLDDALYLLSDELGLVTWTAGSQPDVIDVPVSPPLSDARSIQVAGPGLWILDDGGGSGRVIHYTPGERQARTFALPVSGIGALGVLSSATDFAIDPATNRMIFVVGSELWAVPTPTEG